MLNKHCWAPMFLAAVMAASLAACGSSSSAPPSQPSWETLVNLGQIPSFTDYTPTGKSYLYTANSTSFSMFTFPTGTFATGIITSLTPTVNIGGDYTSFAWVGNKLFMVYNTTVYIYDTIGDVWTSPVTTLDHYHSASQSTADDGGFVYSMSSDTAQLLKFNTADNTYQYIAAPADMLPNGEPRAAWDSTTARVYLSDFAQASVFYAFNPADNSFTALAPHPAAGGFSDAFCSDRRGHIFTNTHNVGAAVWMYTAATDTWTSLLDLPFNSGDSAACTVSANGWLFMANGNTGDFARLKIF